MHGNMEAHIDRTDHQTAALVDRAVYILEISGNVYTAARFLALHEVDVEISMRVLTNPEKRRYTNYSDLVTNY
jgi:hypothetical protein